MNKSYSYSLQSSLIQFEIESTQDNNIKLSSIATGPHHLLEILPRKKLFILNRGSDSLLIGRIAKGDIQSTFTLPGCKILSIKYLRNYDQLAILSEGKETNLSFYKLHHFTLYKIRTLTLTPESEKFISLEYQSTANTLFILSSRRIFSFHLHDKRPGITHEIKSSDPELSHFKILERPGLLAYVQDNVIYVYPLQKDNTLNLKKKAIVLKSDKHQIATIVWSEREDMLYTAGADRSVKRWMIKGNLGVIADEIKVPRPVVSLIVFPVTDSFVIKDDLGELTFYKMASGESLMSFPALEDEESGSNGNQLAIFENEMKIFSPEKHNLKILELNKIQLYKS